MKDTKKLISSETLIRNYDNGFNDGIKRTIEIINEEIKEKANLRKTQYPNVWWINTDNLKQLLEKELK